MIRSMTAFARSERQSEWGTVTWELRSVNHRYLEIFVRLPETLRPLELLVREAVGGFLNRGKVECNLKHSAATGTLAHIALNRPLVERLLAIGSELEELTGSEQGLDPQFILSWPGAVNEAEPDLERFRDVMLSCLKEALKQLVAARSREGDRLAEMILQRCDAMSEHVQTLRARHPEVLLRLREKLMSRLTDLPVDADSGRLEQEMAILAQRLDVDEELDRLDSHLTEIRQVLERSDPVGRRLDFLMQELNREANTLASKSADADTTRSAVELKVLIEQMREQVQNIE